MVTKDACFCSPEELRAIVYKNRSDFGKIYGCHVSCDRATREDKDVRLAKVQGSTK